MGIKIKGRGGDLTGTSKKEKEARAKSFSAKQNTTVKTRMQQSENGFKGESKNEYGLPNGNQQVEAANPDSYTGPKDRKDGAKKDKVGADKYAKGSKSIKVTKADVENSPEDKKADAKIMKDMQKKKIKMKAKS